MSKNPLDSLDPAWQPLVERVEQLVDDRMLLEIAAADYGQDLEVYLASLREIVVGELPVPMGWIPREVLELTVDSETAANSNIDQLKSAAKLIAECGSVEVATQALKDVGAIVEAHA